MPLTALLWKTRDCSAALVRSPTAFSTWCLPSITLGVFEPSTLAAEGPSLPNATQVSRARRVSCKTGLGAKSVRTKSTVLMNFGCTLATKERTVWTRLRWGWSENWALLPVPTGATTATEVHSSAWDPGATCSETKGSCVVGLEQRATMLSGTSGRACGNVVRNMTSFSFLEQLDVH